MDFIVVGFFEISSRQLVLDALAVLNGTEFGARPAVRCVRRSNDHFLLVAR